MIIGIGHKKQVGKDTFYKLFKIINNLDYLGIDDSLYDEVRLSKIVNSPRYYELYDSDSTWIKMMFADKLKQVASVLLNCSIHFWEDPNFKASVVKQYSLTGREILQKIGESMRKEIGEDIWVNSLFNDYDNLNYIVQESFNDGDIEHEDLMDYESKSYTVKPNVIITDVRMPNEAKAIKDRGGILIRIDRNTGFNDNHISETALDDYEDWDYVIDNNGTLTDLFNQVKEIYGKIREENNNG